MATAATTAAARAGPSDPRGLTMATIVARAGEGGTRVSLPTPGQRGVVQSLLGARMNMRRIKPALDHVQESSKAIMKRRRRRAKVRAALRTEADATSRQCAALITKLADETVAQPKVRKALEQIARGLSHMKKALDMEDEVMDDATAIQEAIDSNQALAAELKQQVTDVTALSESWMRIRWTKDATTAVGRGPPGYIAFSPFTAHDPLFEKQDVVQLLTEGGRRSVHT